MRAVVLDTNVIMNDARDLLIEDTLVYIPETVLEELDKHKSGHDDKNFQAREAARILERAEVVVVEPLEYGTVTMLKVDGKFNVAIVALSEYENRAEDYGGNDRRIIEVVQKLGCKLVTGDLHMKFQALAKGVDVSALRKVDDLPVEFVKEFEVTDDFVFGKELHKASILDIDPDYQVGNYSYKFSNPNTNQIKLATIHNGFVSRLGDTTEKELRRQRCAPINAEQLLASKAIQDPTMDLVMIEGLAGSGKNIVAVSNAIRLLETNKDKYTDIVYVRNSVDDIGNKDEEIGFLSGNDEKVAGYLAPLYDTLDFIVRSEINTKGKKKDEIEVLVQEKTDKLISDCGISAMIATGLRGRTFHNTIFIIDELQNAGASTTQKILTRVGKNCKVITIGSNRQIDSAYLNKYNNGLSILLDEATNRLVDTDINMFAITLTKVVRSEMSKFAESLFS